MQGRLGIIISPPLNDLEAAFQAREAALIEIQPKAFPRISAAKIKVAEDHPSQVGEVSNAALAGSHGRIKCDPPDDPDEVLHLDRKEKVKVDDPVGINKPVGEQNPVDSSRCADTRYDLSWHKQGIQNPAADH